MPKLYKILNIDISKLSIEQVDREIFFRAVKLASTPVPRKSDKDFTEKLLFWYAVTVLSNKETQNAYHEYLRDFQNIKDIHGMDIYQLFIDDVRKGDINAAKRLLEKIIVKIMDNGLFLQRLEAAKVLFKDLESKHLTLYTLISEAQGDDNIKHMLLSSLRIAFPALQVDKRDLGTPLHKNISAPTVAIGKSASPPKPAQNTNVVLSTNVPIKLHVDSPLTKRAHPSTLTKSACPKKIKLELAQDCGKENDENNCAMLLMSLKSTLPTNRL